MSPLEAIQPLRKEDDRSSFNCGEPTLDDWFHQFAWENHVAGNAHVYVAHYDKSIVGYYTINSFSTLRESAIARAAKAGPAEIPGLLIGRLAVDQSEQNKGIGAALLKHAMLVAIQASETIGVRVLIVNAIDKRASKFYQRYGFESSPTDSQHLMILIKDIKKTLTK